MDAKEAIEELEISMNGDYITSKEAIKVAISALKKLEKYQHTTMINSRNEILELFKKIKENDDEGKASIILHPKQIGRSEAINALLNFKIIELTEQKDKLQKENARLRKIVCEKCKEGTENMCFFTRGYKCEFLPNDKQVD